MGKKVLLENFLKFYSGLKPPKITTPEGEVMLQVPLCSSQRTLLIPQNAILFPQLPFYFPEVLFHFSKMPYCFREVLFRFPKCLLFIHCVRLFPRMLFAQLIVPSTCPVQKCSERYLPCSFVSSWNYLLTNLWWFESFLCSHSNNKQAPAPVNIIAFSWFDLRINLRNSLKNSTS